MSKLIVIPILALNCIVIALMIIFPPWYVFIDGEYFGDHDGIGYSFFLVPPPKPEVIYPSRISDKPKIDILLLIYQISYFSLIQLFFFWLWERYKKSNVHIKLVLKFLTINFFTSSFLSLLFLILGRLVLASIQILLILGSSCFVVGILFFILPKIYVVKNPYKFSGFTKQFQISILISFIGNVVFGFIISLRDFHDLWLLIIFIPILFLPITFPFVITFVETFYWHKRKLIKEKEIYYD